MTAQAGGASSLQSLAVSSGQPDDRSLRRAVRDRRASLAPLARKRASLALARRVAAARLLRPGQRVAIYMSLRGEMDLAPLIVRAFGLGCRLYLPRIVPGRSGRMEFLRFTGPRTLRRNRFGILEPVSGAKRIAPGGLDRVLVPLVAFDLAGHRLGMGGGYYDRRFAFLSRRDAWRRPKLIGIAYEWQRVTTITPAPWDVSLDAVVSDARIHWPRAC